MEYVNVYNKYNCDEVQLLNVFTCEARDEEK